MKCKKCSKMFTPQAKKKITQICDECGGEIVKNNEKISQNNVDAKYIDISKGQAEILKGIANLIPKNVNISKTSLEKILGYQSQIEYVINENWGTRKYFIDLILSKEPNPISLILYFLNFKNKIGKVPTKSKIREFSKFHLSEYESQFGSWEEFLDLLGFDPWYRNNGEQKEIAKTKSYEKKNEIRRENIPNYFMGNESQIETIEKIKLLKSEIESLCEKKDLDENYSEYSYREMFILLQEYLKILPNETKYNNVNYFL
jgi:hypothetical protein